MNKEKLYSNEETTNELEILKRIKIALYNKYQSLDQQHLLMECLMYLDMNMGKMKEKESI